MIGSIFLTARCQRATSLRASRKSAKVQLSAGEFGSKLPRLGGVVLFPCANSDFYIEQRPEHRLYYIQLYIFISGHFSMIYFGNPCGLIKDSRGGHTANSLLPMDNGLAQVEMHTLSPVRLKSDYHSSVAGLPVPKLFPSATSNRCGRRHGDQVRCEQSCDDPACAGADWRRRKACRVDEVF